MKIAGPGKDRVGSTVWPLRLSPDSGSVAECRMAGERLAGRMPMAARGADHMTTLCVWFGVPPSIASQIEPPQPRGGRPRADHLGGSAPASVEINNLDTYLTERGSEDC